MFHVVVYEDFHPISHLKTGLQLFGITLLLIAEIRKLLRPALTIFKHVASKVSMRKSDQNCEKLWRNSGYAGGKMMSFNQSEEI